MRPFVVVDVEERLQPVDARVVDEDVGLRRVLRDARDAGCVGQVGGDAVDVRAGYRAAQQCERGIDRLLAASVDDDTCAGLREPFGDRQPDAGGGSGDDRGLACQIDVHECTGWKREREPPQGPRRPNS